MKDAATGRNIWSPDGCPRWYSCTRSRGHEGPCHWHPDEMRELLVIDVPPGRFELTEEDYADLPVVDLDEYFCGSNCCDDPACVGEHPELL